MRMVTSPPLPSLGPGEMFGAVIGFKPGRDIARGFQAATRQPGYRVVLAWGDRVPQSSWESVQRGRDLFASNCASCHIGGGLFPEAGMSFNPRPTRLEWVSNYRYGSGDLGVYRSVRFGIPGTGMAAFTQLSNREVWDVVHFVGVLQLMRLGPQS